MINERFTKSPKEIILDERLLNTLEPEKLNGETLPKQVMEILINDEEIAALQDYANHVSIKRLGFNDHGPVHMRTVCKNSIKMLKLLHKAGINTSLEEEGIGNFADSLTAVIFASFMHDIGMTVGRQNHEMHSGSIALPIIQRVLATALPDAQDVFNMRRRIMIQSMAIEGIVGHMGTQKVHSIEAGAVLIGDGCDMTKGRARIPMALNKEAKQGDIHKYSANSIKKVRITNGLENNGENGKPIRIEVTMSSEVGFFQIEEVLLPKINSSTIKPYVELYAGIEDGELKNYI
ncbi:MAG: phosphohydrolase [Treponema sp.]|nr:phosphohydrolase [Treponema sp.]